MLRKLVSGIIALTLATIGLSQATAASAADVTPIKLPVPSYAAGYGIQIPFSDTETVLIGISSTNDTHYLKSGVLHSDGHFDSESELAVLPANSYIPTLPLTSWTITKNGGIALAWTYNTYSQTSSTATAYSFISYSEDGKNWSGPSQLFAPRFIETNGCMFMYQCGYSDFQLREDLNGELAVSVYAQFNNVRSLDVVSSHDGLIWSPPTSLDSENLFGSVLTPMPNGGFSLIWGKYLSSDQGYSHRISTMGTKLGFWSRAKEFGHYPVDAHTPSFVQTDPTHMSLIYVSGAGNVPSIHHRKYDLVAKTWGDPVAVMTLPSGWISGNLQFAMGKNWHGVLAAGGAENGAAKANAYMVDFQNSVPGTQKLIATAEEQMLRIDAARINFDDTVTLVLGNMDKPSRILTLKDGVEKSVSNVPWTSTTQVYQQHATFSLSGNLVLTSTAQNNVYEGMVYNFATSPIPAGDFKLAGVAKKGKTLTSVVPTFSGISNVGLTTFQWYSCAAKVTTVQTAIPTGCIAIAKATTTKFKVGTKQKNKFLALAITNTNPIGTTTLFSPSTAKAK